jgi:DNA polymerase-4
MFADRRNAILAAILVAGTLDILSAFVFGGMAGASPGGVLRFVASGPFGDTMRDGGTAAAALGLGVHYALMTVMVLVYFAIAGQVEAARRYWYVAGTLYGFAIYLVMYWLVLPTRFDVYRREAAVIRGILYRFTPVIEPLSLDEAYLDVSEHPGAPGPLAQVIRGTIFRKTKLTSSAGIGPNKLIAKIASEINKPNGQFEVKLEQVSEFMEKLPVRQIWGIGEKTERKLEELGVKTCGQLQRFSRPELVDLFGKFGLDLYDLCRGIDHRPVEPDRPRKSLSTEETFAADLTTLEQCEEKLEELFQDLMADLAQKESTREITKIFVKLKFHDFTRTTAERAGLAPTLEDFRSLLEEAFARTGKPVRLIGIGVRFAETVPENAQLDLL